MVDEATLGPSIYVGTYQFPSPPGTLLSASSLALTSICKAHLQLPIYDAAAATGASVPSPATKFAARPIALDYRYRSKIVIFAYHEDENFTASELRAMKAVFVEGQHARKKKHRNTVVLAPI